MLTAKEFVPGKKKLDKLIIKLRIAIAAKPIIIPKKKARIITNISSEIFSLSNKFLNFLDGAVYKFLNAELKITSHQIVLYLI